jgi:hypothetical protein
VYELSFPIPHGMSGGPVLLAPQSAEESAIQAIAFASYAHSTPSDVNDTNVPGEGIAVTIASALVTRPWSDATLLDGIRDLRVRDLGRSWPELEVVEHPETGYRVRRRVERAAR